MSINITINLKHFFFSYKEPANKHFRLWEPGVSGTTIQFYCHREKAATDNLHMNDCGLWL